MVEGVGDHGCEYMTGGVVVILGKTGRNFAAGMSGGIAYVYDKDNIFKSRCNINTIDFDPMEPEDIENLKQLIKKHVNYTNSKKGQEILKEGSKNIKRFVKVMPKEYKKALQKLRHMQQEVLQE